MYRRYYQPYERYNDETHRPIDEIQNSGQQKEKEIEEGSVNENVENFSPEIIIPGEPATDNNENTNIRITQAQQYSSPTLFGRIKIEDLLLIAIILILLQEKVPDQILIITLVFILCVGL